MKESILIYLLNCWLLPEWSSWRTSLGFHFMRRSHRSSELKTTFSSRGYDFGYMLKMLTGKLLPDTESDFFELIKIYFPTIYDVKYLMKSCKSLKGGLEEVAKQLEVKTRDYRLSVTTNFLLDRTHWSTASSRQRQSDDWLVVLSYERAVLRRFHRRREILRTLVRTGTFGISCGRFRLREWSCEYCGKWESMRMRSFYLIKCFLFFSFRLFFRVVCLILTVYFSFHFFVVMCCYLYRRQKAEQDRKVRSLNKKDFLEKVQTKITVAPGRCEGQAKQRLVQTDRERDDCFQQIAGDERHLDIKIGYKENDEQQ